MTKTQKALSTKAKQLMRKFYADAQDLFDAEAMDDDLAANPVFEALIGAQGYAEEGAEADV